MGIEQALFRFISSCGSVNVGGITKEAIENGTVDTLNKMTEKEILLRNSSGTTYTINR